MSRKVSKNPADNHQNVDDEVKTVATINSIYSQTRFGDLFREFLRAKNKRKVIELLQVMAKHEKIGIDFDISLVYFLNSYICCNGEITLIDAGFLVESAGRIYARKINALSDRVFEAANGALEEEIQNETSSSPKKQRCPKRTWSPDKPYEADIKPKQFKKLDLSRTTESLTEACTFEPPKQYFKNWKRYKEWRASHLKKTKFPVPYSVVCDNSLLHSSMWNSSRIEDFDYEDDVDSKRNYKVFTKYMEHRYSTLVKDINFIMHFIMKDFIEMEEDEIDIMTLLGLPSPPKRQWPAYITNVPIEDRLHGSLTYDERCDDYNNIYIALENTLLDGLNCRIEKPITKSNDVGPRLPLESSLNLIEQSAVGGEASTSNGYSSINADANTCSGVNKKEQSSESQAIEKNVEENVIGNNLDMKSPEQRNGIITNPDLPIDSVSQEDCSKQNSSEPISSNQSVSQTIELSTINSVNSIASTDNITKENELQVSNKEIENVQANIEPIKNSSENVVQSTEASVLENSQEKVQDSTPSEKVQDSAPSENVQDSTPLENVQDSTPSEKVQDSTPSEKVQDSTSSENVQDSRPLENVQNSRPLENIQDNTPSENIPNNLPSENILSSNCAKSNINNEQPFESISNNLLQTSAVESLNEPTVNNPEIRSHDNITVRLSMDEGVSFSELDEIDLAMITPSVELIDIFGPLRKQNLPKDLTVEVGDHVKSLFEIDDHIMNIEQIFDLSIETVTKRIVIEKNILKLPESLLRKRVLFKLTEEFDIYKNRSCKRKYEETAMETRKRKLLKLEVGRDCSSPGFPESPKTSRTISRDSGIGFPSGEDVPLTPPALSENGQVLQEPQLINPSINSTSTQEKTLSSTESAAENGSLPANNSSINDLNVISQENTLSTSEIAAENGSLPANNSSINDLNVTSQENTLSTSEIVFRNENLNNAGGLDESLSNLNQVLNSTAILSTSEINSGNAPAAEDITLNSSTLEESISNPVLNSTANQINDSIGPTMSSGYHSSFNSSTENSLNIEKDGTQQTTKSITEGNPSEELIHMDDLTFPEDKQENKSDLLSNSKELRNEESAKEMNEMIEKIQAWHRSLKPILAKSKERHHFDVYSLGTEILNKFPSTNDSSSDNNSSVTLKSVMVDNDPSYISRYFLSTLLLANHRNIDLNVEDYNCSEPTKLENIGIKLLTKKRYSISFEDDIGKHSKAKKRPHSPEFIVEEPSQNSEPNILNISNEESQLTMEQHKKDKEIMLEKYKESRKRFLQDEVNANRDNLLRFYSKKYHLDLRLYLSNEDLQRIITDDDPNNLDILADLPFPGKIDLIQRCKKSKPCDETDSGFVSQSQASVSRTS